MISIATRKGIPVVVSNGRMSEKSFNSYKNLSFFSQDIFQKLTLVLAQSSAHKSRFINLGVKSESLRITGSVKYDLKPSELSKSPEIQKFTDKKFILAVSTHSGEDEIILKSFINISQYFENLKLVIVPRHPERTDEIFKIAKTKNISVCIESEGVNDDCLLMIVDSIGKTSFLYQHAEAAFVGGSLVQRGGHNIIEPAFFECPIIIGPSMFNFETIAEDFIINNACRVVYDDKSLAAEFIDILNNNTNKLSMIDSASMIIEKNSGASELQLSAIINELNGV